VLDGLGATRRIREFEDAGAFGAYSVPIVAVSGNARDEWTERAQRSGMDGPYHPHSPGARGRLTPFSRLHPQAIQQGRAAERPEPLEATAPSDSVDLLLCFTFR
jgi:CheY-like chemotaxis protein